VSCAGDGDSARSGGLGPRRVRSSRRARDPGARPGSGDHGGFAGKSGRNQVSSPSTDGQPRLRGGPVPPPAGKNYGLALAEVIGIDALIWGIDYAMGKPYVKISAASISQNFKKDWIEANVAASIDAYEDDDMDGLPDPLG
jgi:hypothetical protein